MPQSKPFLILSATLLLLFPFSIRLAHGDDIESLSLKIADKLGEQKKIVVSVLDFIDRDGEPTDAGQYLADEIADILVNLEHGFDVVDRSVIDETLNEESAATVVMKKPFLVKKIESLTGVEMLVFGTIAPARNHIRVNIKMLDTVTERMIWESASNIRPNADLKELLGMETRPSASRRSKSIRPASQFKNKYLRATVTSVGISPKYKTATVGLLIENISKEDIKIALRPPADPIYLVQTSATLIDDAGIICQGAETSGVKTEEFSMLTAKSSTVVIISFNCDTVPEGEFATMTADFFAEARQDRADFSMGIPRIQMSAASNTKSSSRR